MEIKLITGATAFEAAKNTLKFVDMTDFDKENLIVVPDSFSMQAESLVFDVLKTKASFNTEIVGISRLASKILRRNNISFERISGLEEVFCIFKAIKEEEKNFKYFKKCSVDYSIKILQIIKQFKACKLKPCQIAEVGDALLDNKMHDLRIIYEKYEKLLSEKLDLSRLLIFFVENLENNIDLSKTNLFFINFDSFSMEINSFICSIAKRVNSLYIGYARPLSPNNAFIYENDIFKKTTKYAAENGLLVQEVGLGSSLQNQQLKIVTNLFGLSVENGQDDFFVNLVAKNRKDEVEAVAKFVKFAIFKGAKFKDFAVAVADKAYFDLVREIFPKYELAFYCDDAADLSQTILGSFLLKLLRIAKVGFSQENLQYIAHSLILNIQPNDKALFDIKYFNIQDEKEFLERFVQYQNVVSLIKLLTKSKKITDFSEVLMQIMKKYRENYENLLDILQKTDAKKASENKQSFELIVNLLEKLSQLGGDDDFSLFDFDKLLQTSLQSVKVETIPTYIDAIFVGDATDSYFQDVDTLFVLGATANALPRNRGDVGILDDEDLKKLSLKVKLEPEIKVINRRNRLKIFELLQHAKRKLVVSFPLKEDDALAQKSSVVEDLQIMFGNNIVHTSSFEDFDVQNLSKNEILDKFLFYLGNKNNLLDAYSHLKGLQKLPEAFEGALKNSITQNIAIESKVEMFPISEKTENLFKLNKVSASQLETYFRCPFSHFVKYILKINEFRNVEPTKLQFGSLQHLLLEKYFKNPENQKVDEEQFASKFIDEFAGDFYDEKILKRKYFVDFLKKESKIILKNAKNEQKISDFKPISLEEKIYYPLFEKINLSGVVDRIDKSGNYFRILDYKTGDTQNIRKELFYGKKLQLFLYANCVKELTGLDLAGVFYFDCQTKFLKVGENQKLFNGLILKDENVILKTDYRLEELGQKSDIVAVDKCKVTKKNPFGYRGACMVESFDDVLSYAKEVSRKALDEIEMGYVKAKPLEGVCQWCAYKAICRHRDVQLQRKMESVKEENLKRKKQ